MQYSNVVRLWTHVCSKATLFIISNKWGVESYNIEFTLEFFSSQLFFFVVNQWALVQMLGMRCSHRSRLWFMLILKFLCILVQPNYLTSEQRKKKTTFHKILCSSVPIIFIINVPSRPFFKALTFVKLAKCILPVLYEVKCTTSCT